MLTQPKVRKTLKVCGWIAAGIALVASIALAVDLMVPSHCWVPALP